MEPIFYKSSFKTPKVVLNKDTGEFLISGRSLPENPKAYYTPILDWMNDYFSSPNELTKFIFEIEYFNTASSKMVLEIMYILTRADKAGHKVEIHWRYEEEDDEMQEAGSDYSQIIKMPIIIEPIEESDDE
jgi:SiaC family regulatory phosphoprotein